MTISFEDPTAEIVDLLLNQPQTRLEIAQAKSKILGDVEAKRFNRERAIEIFLIAFERSLMAWLVEHGMQSLMSTYSKPWRLKVASGLANAWVDANGFTNDRQARRGLVALLLGK